MCEDRINKGYFRVIRGLLDYKIAIVSITIVFVILGFFYGSVSEPKGVQEIYKSSSKVLILVENNSDIEILDNLAASGDLILSDYVADKIIAENMLNIKKEQLHDILYADYDSMSGTLEIITLFGEPEKTKEINKSALKYGVEEIQKVLSPENIHMVSQPEEPTRVTVTQKGDDVIDSQSLEGVQQLRIKPFVEQNSEEHRNIKMSVLLGCFGFAIACIVAIGVTMLIDNVKYPRDVKRVLGVQVSGALGINDKKKNSIELIKRLSNSADGQKCGFIYLGYKGDHQMLLAEVQKDYPGFEIVDLGNVGRKIGVSSEIKVCDLIVLVIGYNTVRSSTIMSLNSNLYAVGKSIDSVVIADVPIEKYGVAEEFIGIYFKDGETK